MEKNSAASNENAVGNTYPEELREKGEAALTLVTMRYSKADKRTSIVLGRMNEEFLGESEANPDGENKPQSQESLDNEDKVEGYLPLNESFKAALKKGLEPKLPLFGQAIDGLSPPKFPPIKNLQGLIGSCGKPFEKQLTESDVKPHQSRLSIPKDLVQMFVKPQIIPEEEDPARGIPVVVHDSKGKEHPMEFKTWAKNKIHVLMLGGRSFAMRISLKLWKIGSPYGCFAIIKLRSFALQ